jgi:hypothetical protein
MIFIFFYYLSSLLLSFFPFIIFLPFSTSIYHHLVYCPCRFADIFGLDLQEVKTFTDEIPRIPRRAFQDLDVDMSDYDIGSPRGSTPVFNKFFMPQQQQQHKIQVGSITVPILVK